MKVKKQNKNIPPLPLPVTRIAGLAQLKANISQTPRGCKIHDTFTPLDHPPHKKLMFVGRLTLT